MLSDGWPKGFALDTIIGEVPIAASAFTAHLIHAKEKRPLILCTSDKEADRLASDLRLFAHDVLEYPAWESLPSEEIPPSKDTSGRRLKLIAHLAKAKAPLIVTTPAALCQKTLSQESLELLKKTLKVKERLAFNDLGQDLLEMGFVKVAVVQDKGQFATRRGIYDIFDCSAKTPVRIEFFDNEIESIRTFDPASQKSTGTIQEVHLLPADEFGWAKSDPASLFDHLQQEPILLFDNIAAIEDQVVFLKRYAMHQSTLFESFPTLFRRLNYPKLFLCREKIAELFPHQNRIELFGEKLQVEESPPPYTTCERALFTTDPIRLDNLAQVLSEAMAMREQTCHITFVCDNDQEEKHLRNKLHNALELPQLEGHFMRGYLSHGFFSKDKKRGFLPYTELTDHYKVRRQAQRTRVHHTAAEIFSPVPGDLVVHYHAGVGRYLGIEKKTDHTGVVTEFLAIEYAGSSKLFVPMPQAYLLSPYVGAGEKRPQLNNLSSNKWQKTKAQTQKAIVGYAKQLVEVYAARQIGKAHSYTEDSDMMHAFERSFPYTETDDQLLAIQDIKRDMLQKACMDRLICGDVGYGKTEVAMRAAFKAVVDGSVQVAALVPTTVLAMQHYDTFTERMGGFPVRIATISRATKSAEVKKILAEVKAGSIDIVIGTHRLLSQDVEFAKLGLIIIDEEQRFGVRAKERLKMARAQADCLTLSATPIPRTLYMAISGARQMSTIATPPSDRLPIQMVVCEQTDEVIERAISRELGRGGQVFYIHNRIESIATRAQEISKLAGDATVAIAHGQMPQTELDRVFHAFRRGDADILVATTLIENGVDIPQANTILIERADRYGLSDLYQMKGRVGRGSRAAYAYFLTPENREIREDASKRLKALVEAGSCGGGMRVAMRDLEIRGSGDLLGIEQSGHASSIGFHLYCRLLQKAVAALQGNKTFDWIDTKIEFPYPAHITREYVESEEIRLDLYRRLAEVSAPEGVDAIFREIEDRFGQAPESVVWLWQMMRIKAYSAGHGWVWIKIEKERTIAHKQTAKETKAFAFATPKTEEPRALADAILAILASK